MRKVRPQLIFNQQGMTLMELMMVIGMVGILSSMAVPQFKKFSARARMSEAKIQLAAAYTAEKAFYMDYDSYHTCLDYMGYDPGDASTRYYAIGIGGSLDPGIDNTLRNKGLGDGCNNGPMAYSAGKAVGGQAITGSITSIHDTNKIHYTWDEKSISLLESLSWNQVALAAPLVGDMNWGSTQKTNPVAVSSKSTSGSSTNQSSPKVTVTPSNPSTVQPSSKSTGSVIQSKTTQSSSSTPSKTMVQSSNVGSTNSKTSTPVVSGNQGSSVVAAPKTSGSRLNSTVNLKEGGAQVTQVDRGPAGVMMNNQVAQGTVQQASDSVQMSTVQNQVSQQVSGSNQVSSNVGGVTASQQQVGSTSNSVNMNGKDVNLDSIKDIIGNKLYNQLSDSLSNSSGSSLGSSNSTLGTANNQQKLMENHRKKINGSAFSYDPSLTTIDDQGQSYLISAQGKISETDSKSIINMSSNKQMFIYQNGY